MKVRITFPLVQDEDDYPPFRSETMWATETADPARFVVDNIPFFARHATVGDLVQARFVDGVLMFDKLVTRSTSSLVRVILFDAERIEEVRATLRNLGCSSESFAGRPIIAVDVPGDVSLERVQEYLHDLERSDVATYEEPILRHPLTH